MNVASFYLDIWEHPHAPKNYRNLVAYYDEAGLKEEADAIRHLLKEEFAEFDNLPNIDKE